MAATQQPPSSGLVSIGLLVPGHSIAKVIGKAGAGLKQIRESTGCKLQVSENVGDNSIPRRMSITGFPQSVGMAVQQALMKSYPDEAHRTTVTIFIPPELAGVVVGKAGTNLKRVREFWAVRLDLDRDPVNDSVFGAERKITMSGSWGSMGQALAMALGGAVPLSPCSPHASGTMAMLGIPTPQHGLSLSQYGLSQPSAALGSGMSNFDVRQVSDADDIQLHMSVPERLVGALLGKEGAQIKLVAAESGCKLCMNSKDMGERRVVIIGKYSRCVAAQSALQQQIVECAGIELGTSNIILFVRSSLAGAVIGKGGATLKLIRKETGTRIQVGREEVQGQRPCTISGSDAQVMQAISMIHDVLSKESVEEAHGPASDTFQSSAIGTAAVSSRAPRDCQRLGGEGGTTKILVPAKTAGAVIGKQGAGLARIRVLCGVELEMLSQAQAPQWQEDRIVSFSGLLENRETAVMNVLHSAFQQDASNAHLKMLVSNREAGAVIGKHGATLKRIRDQCGINVHMGERTTDSLGDRLITAEGSLSAIILVARWVMWSIDGREE